MIIEHSAGEGLVESESYFSSLSKTLLSFFGVSY